jgi:hypothetical protein
MNKKAEEESMGTLMANVVFVILVALFFGGMSYYGNMQKNGAGIWADFYLKEIVKVADMAKPGDEVVLNVQNAVEIAVKNGVGYEDIFDFDNAQNEICVKLSPSRHTCYKYFNNVDLVEMHVILGAPENLLVFKVAEKQKKIEVNA